MPSPIVDVLRSHVQLGETADVENLLSIVQVPQDVGYEMMCLAAKFNHTSVIRVLLRFGYPVNSPPNCNVIGPTPLHYACTLNNLEIVHLLLDKGADINAQY